MATTSSPRVPIVKGFPFLSESAGILTSRTLTRSLSMMGFASCRGAARRKNSMNVEVDMSVIVQGSAMFAVRLSQNVEFQNARLNGPFPEVQQRHTCHVSVITGTSAPIEPRRDLIPARQKFYSQPRRCRTAILVEGYRQCIGSPCLQCHRIVINTATDACGATAEM